MKDICSLIIISLISSTAGVLIVAIIEVAISRRKKTIIEKVEEMTLPELLDRRTELHDKKWRTTRDEEEELVIIEQILTH